MKRKTKIALSLCSWVAATTAFGFCAWGMASNNAVQEDDIVSFMHSQQFQDQYTADMTEVDKLEEDYEHIKQELGEDSEALAPLKKQIDDKRHYFDSKEYVMKCMESSSQGASYDSASTKKTVSQAFYGVTAMLMLTASSKAADAIIKKKEDENE